MLSTSLWIPLTTFESLSVRHYITAHYTVHESPSALAISQLHWGLCRDWARRPTLAQRAEALSEPTEVGACDLLATQAESRPISARKLGP